MMRARIKGDQNFLDLHEHDASVRTADLARKSKISKAKFHNWKTRLGGMDVSSAKYLKTLEAEHGRLKMLPVAWMPDTAAMRELVPERSWCPPRIGRP